jgi:(p)ppGpp synthase/HD superfamily hydrolase
MRGDRRDIQVRPYALTYPQLAAQAMAQGAGDDELARLRAAYDFTERMVDGLYRAQGVPFVCHLVRTASIVLAERQPLDVVIASMVHSAYMLHGFERSRRAQGGAWHRSQVVRRFGHEVEALIQAYDRLPWRSPEAVAAHVRELDGASSTTRSVLLMRLANELEDYLDLGMAFRGRKTTRQRLEACGRQMAELAGRLGSTQLAEELRQAFADYTEASLPAAVLRGHRDAYELPRRHWAEHGMIGLWMARAMRWLRAGRNRTQPKGERPCHG